MSAGPPADSDSSTAREAILTRIRGALADVPAGEPVAWERAAEADPAVAYATSSEQDAEALAELFAERCGDYRATVTRCSGDEAAIAAAVGEALAGHGVRAIATPADLPHQWLPAGVEVSADDPPLALAELDRVEGVLTGCALAIAVTGTIALDSGHGQGRRALTLVPDLHVCVVRAEQIVFGVPEAIEALGATVRDSRSPITLISGPSATSDIELERVEGVHGPRRLEVVLAG
jgi:L-lactate dehydrogenase complex protein LldG